MGGETPFVRPLKGLREGARGFGPNGRELQAGCRASSSPTAAASPPMSLTSVYS
jgi:hypothetical protein